MTPLVMVTLLNFVLHLLVLRVLFLTVFQPVEWLSAKVVVIQVTPTGVVVESTRCWMKAFHLVISIMKGGQSRHGQGMSLIFHLFRFLLMRLRKNENFRLGNKHIGAALGKVAELGNM